MLVNQRHPIIRGAFLALCLIWAQPEAQANSTSKVFTLHDMADSALVADSLSKFHVAEPLLHAKLKNACLTLKSVENIKDDLGFLEILKAQNPSALKASKTDMGKVLREVELVKTLFINELKSALQAAGISDDRILSLREPITAYQRHQVQKAFERNENKLARYEQRFGPTSPKLNILEAGLTYALQAVPGFGPSDNGPGFIEPVFRYSTTYAVLYTDRSQDIPNSLIFGSLWECGMRFYWYSDANDSPSFWSLLKPLSIGVGAAFAASQRDWFFLINDETFDPGLFVDLGAIKAAMTFGDNPRIFVGRQFQLVPHLF